MPLACCVAWTAKAYKFTLNAAVTEPHETCTMSIAIRDDNGDFDPSEVSDLVISIRAFLYLSFVLGSILFYDARKSACYCLLCFRPNLTSLQSVTSTRRCGV